MLVANASQLSTILNRLSYDHDESYTALSIDYHTPFVEDCDKVMLINSIINIFKKIMKNGEPQYDDIDKYLNDNHKPGDVNMDCIIMSEYFTPKINELLKYCNGLNNTINIDDFADDFKALYKPEDNGITDPVCSVLKTTLDHFTGYLSLFDNVDWDKVRDHMLINMVIDNPIDNSPILTMPITEVVVGVYCKNYTLRPLLKTKIVGPKLRAYFDAIRENNSDIEKTKRIDVYAFDNKLERVLKYHVYVKDNSYAMVESYSY